jgi:hypothetical protein
MKKLKVLLSNFSDDNNLSDSVSIIYNKYKKENKEVDYLVVTHRVNDLLVTHRGKSSSQSDITFQELESPNSPFEGIVPRESFQQKVICDRSINEIIDKLSDENLLNDLSNDLSNEEIKIQNNNDKVLNIMDKVSNSYLKIYKLLENNNKVLNDLLENINSDNIKISVKQQKLVEITKAVISAILIILNSKYEDENLFTIFENKYTVKKGYDLLYCKKGKNIPLYYVNSYRLRFSNQGLGKIVPYDKNLEFKNEYYIGGKFIETKSNEEIKHELKKAIKRLNRLQDYFNTQYTISASIYNNLRILYD